jgi:superfamily II DNA helicase RecQ
MEGKEAALAAWADGEERVIVATTALGTGVDVAGINTVIHLGRPHRIVDFAQEVGRAGRAEGEAAQSTIVLEASEAR